MGSDAKKVERVEVNGPPFYFEPVDNPTAKVYDLKGWKFYAERPLPDPEPETPKVERVEIWSDSRNANARLYAKAESRYFRKEDGWKFYAERPLPPPPKKEEPTNEELAQLLEGLAESHRFNNETNRHNTHLAAARLRSIDQKEKGP